MSIVTAIEPCPGVGPAVNTVRNQPFESSPVAPESVPDGEEKPIWTPSVGTTEPIVPLPTNTANSSASSPGFSAIELSVGSSMMPVSGLSGPIRAPKVTVLLASTPVLAPSQPWAPGPALHPHQFQLASSVPATELRTPRWVVPTMRLWTTDTRSVTSHGTASLVVMPT